MAATMLSAACSKRVTVEIPPRVDLYSYDVIGMVEFTSEAEEGSLEPFATQRFIQAVQRAQPGVQVLELGTESELMKEIGRERLDHAAIRAIGERYGVNAVVVGALSVSDVRPNVNLYNVLNSMSVSAEVDAALTARLLETTRGATVWTQSARCTRTVAHAGISRNGPVRFDAEDPERAYGELVNTLVTETTRDFRVTYTRQ
jgi:hypothetical protein